MILSVLQPMCFLVHRVWACAQRLRHPVGICALVLLPLLALAPASAAPIPLQDTDYPIPSGAYFVSPTGSDANPGTASAPLLTLGRAVAMAPNSATIVLRGGVYRETVTWTGKALTIQPYPHEQVWMKGSVVVTGWVVDGTIWRHDGWTYQFVPTVDTNTIDPAFPMAKFPDQTFIDGVPLKQVATKNAVVPGSFFVDYPTQKLYIGNDPTGHVVEGSAYPMAINIDSGPSSSGTIIRGLGFRDYAPHYESDQGGMVRVISAGVTFHKNTFAYSACAGLVIKNADMVIQDNLFVYNSESGMAGDYAHRTVIEGNYVGFNNQEHFALGWDANGIKLLNSDNVIWRDNLVEYNLTGGLWCDTKCHNHTFVRNVIRNNNGSGIFYELSGGALIASNLVYDNNTGVSLTGSNLCTITNNTLANNGRNISILNDGRLTGDPTAPGIAQGNVLKNNILSNNDGSSQGLLHLDDFTDTYTGEQMVTANDYNAYYRTSSAMPVNVINWERGVPGDLAHYTSLAAFVSAKAPRESHGLGLDNQPTNPFFVDEPNGNYHLKANSPAKGSGEALPQAIVDAVNAGLATPVVTAGAPVDRGALAWPEMVLSEAGR